MGTKSSAETVIAILKAFLDRRQWLQADLARHVGVESRALRRRLIELQASGIPLKSRNEPPHVEWRVPKTWFPGGVLLTSEQIEVIFHLLTRIGKSDASRELMTKLLDFLPSPEATAATSSAIVPMETTEREERFLPVIDEAARKSVALEFRYYSQRSGMESDRFASVHRVLVGPPARFVATCHRSGELRFFRVEGVSEARLAKAEPFRVCDSKVVDAHVRASLDGFHEGGEPRTHVFFVQNPDARWVARNLIDPKMRADVVPNGIRVTTETAGLNRLARFVVGLGAAAKPLTPELEKEVATIARGALASIDSSGAG